MGNARVVRLLATGLVVVLSALVALAVAWGTRSAGANWPDVFQRAGSTFGGSVGVCAALTALYRAIGGGADE
ncbi:hypothetical protein [Streptomyces sp. JB150]|uniref:hypothetical protein n=1 Tax=Streptomyces sp. JB150 TaxID=2714844 RepID=UPI001407B5B8|nr:hypothetical protein [Streptomyces sp. JB150]QIJ60719.1 hypothetical protein G7Z13_00720 [Streptomyces sp. JB150]